MYSVLLFCKVLQLQFTRGEEVFFTILFYTTKVGNYLNLRASYSKLNVVFKGRFRIWKFVILVHRSILLLQPKGKDIHIYLKLPDMRSMLALIQLE